MRELLELVRACHEVGLAADLDEHADAPAVDVGLDQALRGGAVGALARLRDPALAQQLDGGVLIAAASRRAFLHSMMPAPVASRRALTSAALAV